MLFGWLVFDDRLLPIIQGTTSELLKHLSLLFVPAASASWSTRTASKANGCRS